VPGGLGWVGKERKGREGKGKERKGILAERRARTVGMLSGRPPYGEP